MRLTTLGLVLVTMLAITSTVMADKVICIRPVKPKTPNVHTQDWESVAMTDVWQTDLVTGMSELLISHESLPREFKTRIRDATPSHNGDYFLVNSAAGMIITYKDGRVDRQYESFHWSDEDPKLEDIDPGCWVWNRKTGKMIRLVDDTSHRGIGLTWSPKRSLLLIDEIFESDDEISNRNKKPGIVQVYDPATNKMTRLGAQIRSCGAKWTPDSRAVMIREYHPRSLRLFRDWYVPLTGKPRVTPGWTTPEKLDMRSHRGSPYAVWDKGTMTLSVLKKGRMVPVTVINAETDDGFYSVTTTFDRSGKRIAFLSSYVHGEPHINLDENLWVADLRTGKTRACGYWSQSCGYDTMRSVLAWSRRGDGLIINEDGGSGFRLVKYVLAKSKIKKFPLFDSTATNSWFSAYIPD